MNFSVNFDIDIFIVNFNFLFVIEVYLIYNAYNGILVSGVQLIDLTMPYITQYSPQ